MRQMLTILQLYTNIGIWGPFYSGVLLFPLSVRYFPSGKAIGTQIGRAGLEEFLLTGMVKNQYKIVGLNKI